MNNTRMHIKSENAGSFLIRHFQEGEGRRYNDKHWQEFISVRRYVSVSFYGLIIAPVFLFLNEQTALRYAQNYIFPQKCN